MSLTVINATIDGERMRMRVEDGTIAKIGPRIRPRDGDEVIDANGMVEVSIADLETGFARTFAISQRVGGTSAGARGVGAGATPSKTAR